MNSLTWAEAGFSRIWEATWQATVLAGLVLVIQSACQRRMPAFWRHFLWAPVLLRLLLPFAPESSISLFNLGKLTAYIPVARPHVTIRTNLPALNVQPVRVSGDDLMFTQGNEQAKANSTSLIGMVVALIWALGSAALLLKTALGAWLLSIRLKRQASNVTEELSTELREAKERVHFRGNFQVVETERVVSPALFGIWKPLLLLPKGLTAKLNQEELRHVLIHEATHLKRHDLVVTWFLEVARCLHWFNPFVWLIVSRCRADAELACDEMALSKLADGASASYGKTILKLLDNLDGFLPAGVSVGILENRSRMKQRVEALANYERRKFSWRWMILVLMVGVTGLSKAKSDREPEVPKPQQAAASATENDTVKDKTDRTSLPYLPRKEANGGISPFENAVDEWTLPPLRFSGEALESALRRLNAEFMRTHPESTNLFYFHHVVVLDGSDMKSTNNKSGETVFSAHAVGYVDERLDGEATMVEKLGIKITTPDLNGRSLRQALDEIVRGASQKLEYEIKTQKRQIGIFLADGGTTKNAVGDLFQQQAFVTRTFKVDPYAFVKAMQTTTGAKPDIENIPVEFLDQKSKTLQTLVLNYFQKCGLDFSKIPPRKDVSAEGFNNRAEKALFFNDRTGVLFVRATKDDLDVIKHRLHALNVGRTAAPSSIDFQIRFAQLKEQGSTDDFWEMVTMNSSTSTGLTHSLEASALRFKSKPPGKGFAPVIKGILSEVQSQRVKEKIEQTRGVDLLSAPRVTTLSGRQAQVSSTPGPAVDLIGTVNDERTAIHLALNLSFTNGKQELPIEYGGAEGDLGDGETVVLEFNNPKNPGNPFLVLVTGAILDQKGKRLHQSQSANGAP